MRFEYRNSKRYPVKADIVAQELERIWKEHNQQLTPVDVIEEARPEAAPLHPIFEWDNQHAAEGYRRWQARCLIRDVRVIHEKTGIRMSQFIHVRSERPNERINFYQHYRVLPRRPVEYQSALREARKVLQSAQNSFRELEQIAAKEPTDPELQKIHTIVESLGTARAVAETLQ